MKALFLLAGVACLVGCVRTPSPSQSVGVDTARTIYNGSLDIVYVVEDKATGATCYVYDGYNSGGIHCIEDNTATAEDRTQ